MPTNALNKKQVVVPSKWMVSAGSSFQPAFTGFALATWPFFAGKGLALIVLQGSCSTTRTGHLRLSTLRISTGAPPQLF